MDRKRFFIIIIVVLWVVLNLSLFRREIKAIGKMPEYMSLTYEERKIKIDGQVFSFADSLMQLTPDNSSILFLYENGVDLRKVLYYAYPRTLKPITDYNNLESSGFLKADYLAVYLPKDPNAASFFIKIDSNPVFDKLYEKAGGAIYKINKEKII